MTEQELFLAQLFNPKAMAVYARVQGKRFVHYTSAQNGLTIIKNAEMWMRHASVMNDFMEIEHGAECLKAAWDSQAGQVFKTWLAGLFDGFLDRLVNEYNNGQEHLKNETYLTSVSVHEDGAEDAYGRLSMWRAYGATTGVALVVNPTAFMGDSEVLGAYSAPVIYQNHGEFVAWYAEWTATLMAQEAMLKALGPDEVFAYLIHAFRQILLCTKHPGFYEEQEWRIYHTPAFDGGPDKALVKSFETVHGVPQPVMKIPLRPEVGVPGLAIRELLDRVIIGPTEHAYPIYLAFKDALQAAGIEGAGAKITRSNIPLRQ
ncbi:DUF2971 domain-containing protein [Caulobacter sp. 602-2]|uniref:DUF2971 domain-containing protein n=1 Tax=Caulobacter sp. 602-2 TaxID=2710887 RepID=A0A6G4QYX7_9CAUL|nr:DUF2971 domain-containing protein [Caulobacter sp. 602-2]NGM50667.1 DUF2971 domain-containing protein [Caulobacter sp. 602-2]